MTVYAPIMQIVGKSDIRPATPYGYVIDYLYAVNHFDNDGTMGSNIARRAGWRAEIYIYARAFTDEELAEQCIENPLPHGVFMVDALGEREYDITSIEMQATDRLIGVRA